MTQLLSPNSLRVDASEILSFVSASAKLGPVEASILEYVIGFHGKEAQRRSAFISLLIHAGLLARGARPYSDSASTSALLPPSWASSDPIRVSYSLTSRPKYGTLASSSSQLQMSVAETDSQIFINLTDTTTDKFGHLELSGPEQVRLDSLSDSNLLNLSSIFPHLSELVEKIEETLWKPVLPCPPVQRTVEDKKLVPIKIPDGPVSRHSESRPQLTGFSEYGRSDLDPLGSLLLPPPLGTRPFGPTGVFTGGMLLDPRRPQGAAFGPGLSGGPDVLPHGSVPPGARFDPFGPGVLPGRRGQGPPLGLRPQPDPDHAMPPDFENMYM